MLDKLLPVFGVVALSLCLAQAAGGDSPDATRRDAARLQRDGNFRDAAALFRALALDPAASPKDAARDLDSALACYLRVNEPGLARELMDQAREQRQGSWRVLFALAQQQAALPAAPGPGPRRRPRPSGGDAARAESIRLMLAAEAALASPADPAAPAEAREFYAWFADLVMQGREDRLAWRLTARTDVDADPDPEDDVPLYRLPQRDAPVGADGNPVYYPVPASWDAAANDGERWRWLLARLAGCGDPGGPADADVRLGAFLTRQFGVQTMSAFSPLPADADIGGATGPFAVRTLAEDETIARLATGLKRFAMPPAFNHIAILRRVADAASAPLDARCAAISLLARIFENRQQYDKAVALWTRLQQIAGEDVFGAAATSLGVTPDSAGEAIRRITGATGVLESGPVAPAGSVTSLSYLFRNGSAVTMTAKRLDERLLIQDIKGAVNAGGDVLQREYMFQRPDMLGRAVVENNRDRYVRETVATWDVGLTPLPGHYSRRTQIDLPFTNAGCYLVEAAMRNGNTSRIVLWLDDLALVRNNFGDRQMLFVADADGGDPVPGANLTFMGYSVEYDHERDAPRFARDVFAERADADGLCFVETARLEDKDWLIAAETDDGRFAYLGFDRVWPVSFDQRPDRSERAFIITDRPVYRPGNDMRFKVWIGRPDYSGKSSASAGRPVRIMVDNPRGETIYDKTLTTDAFGGVDGAAALDENAALGAYFIRADGIGGGVGFRLEEYKTPEFAVTVETPPAAVVLGDTVSVKVKAAYYHGAPVQNAKVAYKILRTAHRSDFTPAWRWDWLYGSGAWIRTYDYSWYPGFAGWGRIGPRPPWLPMPFEQPEMVAEGEGELDADGVFRIALDTAPAKALFGDTDHAYTVTAEVTDRSRRAIVGSGKAVAARKPFSVTVWTDRGYSPAGQAITADVRAALPLGGGVKASGTATLYRIAYDDAGRPSERETLSQPLATDGEGAAQIRLAAPEAGQYRLGCVLTDDRGNRQESSVLITVRGRPGEGDFRFAALELVPDKREYAPGDTVRLAVHSEHKDALVLFVPHADNKGGSGVISRPDLLRLENGALVVDIPVGAADQPNFFCEAVTVYKGRVYTETREIFVPPADKTLTVQVTPSRESFAPGEKAEFTVKVTGGDGRPVAGQCVVSVYDKAVEYISGGPNVRDIRETFWNWKRYYQPTVTASLGRTPFAVARRGDEPWQPIGVFGDREADWTGGGMATNGLPLPRARGAAFGGMAAGRGVMRAAMPMAENAAITLAAPAPAQMMALEQEAVAMEPGIAVDAAAYAGGGMADAAAFAEASVRSEFADTALWIAALETDAGGNAAFSFDAPENLTAWKVRAWVMGDMTRAGEGGEEVETRKNVIVRPQTPRFLTQKDRVVLSANLHNYLPRGKEARAELVLEGGLLELAAGEESSRAVTLPANGEARVDWIADAVRPGTARIVMKLLTDEESDAAEVILPVIVHGARKVENFAGVIRGDAAEAVVNITVPKERLADQSKLALSFSPSLAASMLDALPYLVEYPYGCTEQTLNRFLPLVMTRKYLDDMGVTLARAKTRLDNAPTDAQSEAWKDTWGDPRAAREASPVFDDAELQKMVATGVERLTAMQNPDGGWGWFSGPGEQSWPHTTAVVVYGLAAARDKGAAIPTGVLDDGVNWLRSYQRGQIAKLKIDPETDDAALKAKRKARADNIDAFIYMILARDGRRPLDPDMRDFLYRDRQHLSRAALAMFGIALHHENATNALSMTLDNLRQYVKTDPVMQTAWLDTPEDGWWRWYNDGIETQAWYLKLLARVEPAGETAAGVAKYLLLNRKNGTYWRSTRDTASAVEALAEYGRASGEADPDGTVTLYLDGKAVMERKLTPATMLDDNRFTLDGLAVEEGRHTLRLARSGRGNVYFGGSLSVFSLEDPIAAAGLGLTVERAFYRLTPEEKTADRPSASGGAVAARVERYRRDRIDMVERDGRAGPGMWLRSGDLVEVELTIAARSDYEYLVFEDMKAAGLEAVEIRSGYGGNELGAYVEYRDQKVALFVRHLPRGEYRVAYRFRAETPGWYSALPTFGGGMYATDLFANSDEMKIAVGEDGVFGENR